MRRPSRFGIWELGFGIVIATTLVAASACSGTAEVKPPASPSPAVTATPVSSPAVSPSPAASGAAGKAEMLVGRWPGASGAYLNITKKGDKYSIEIADASGPKTYEGTARGDMIEFTRNGKTETVKAGTGGDTGVKGFEKETNCVVVTKGSEGFCKK